MTLTTHLSNTRIIATLGNAITDKEANRILDCLIRAVALELLLSSYFSALPQFRSAGIKFINRFFYDRTFFQNESFSKAELRTERVASRIFYEEPITNTTKSSNNQSVEKSQSKTSLGQQKTKLHSSPEIKKNHNKQTFEENAFPEGMSEKDEAPKGVGEEAMPEEGAAPKDVAEEGMSEEGAAPKDVAEEGTLNEVSKRQKPGFYTSPEVLKFFHEQTGIAPTNGDPYSFLGLKNDATSEQAKKAYRQLAKKLHPDKHNTESAEKRNLAERAFELIQTASEAQKP